MTFLALAAWDRTLEFGTGSGYLTAVKPGIAGAEHVSTVEFNADFGETARERLAEFGYEGVSVRIGVGQAVKPDHALFDNVYLNL